MKENTDLSNQIDAMVYQCQRMNAGKLRISFKREDGYTIETTSRRTRLVSFAKSNYADITTMSYQLCQRLTQ